jgi:transposase
MVKVYLCSLICLTYRRNGSIKLLSGGTIKKDDHFEATTEVTADFVRLLLVLYPAQPTLLLLNRAPWHHGPALAQVLDENSRLELMYFPPACPDLNPQEHVWERARDAISHNHTFPVLDRLISDFEDYLNETYFATTFMEHYTPPIDTAIFE